jgi:sugar/nucleoside kinase (ribokinase family)
VIIGTGLVALDVVVPNSLAARPQLCAGGTCGNVLTALAFLGWESYPIARLSKDGASKHVADDLKQWNVNLDFVTFEEDGSTPVVIQRIRNRKDGEPVHSFSRKCPGCGATLPWYKAVRVADISSLFPRLPDAQVIFFDRTSRGALSLAQQGRDKGAIVFFEPSATSDPGHLEEALNLAHIVKIASDRIGGNEAVLSATKPNVIIETHGRTGLRLRLNSTNLNCDPREWFNMPPIPVESLRDSAGAGDWCTAGLIHMLGAQGAGGLEDINHEEVLKAVHVGQAMASWSCGFDGPRGGMYQTTNKAFHNSVRDLLSGQPKPYVDVKQPMVTPLERHAYVCESCAAGSRVN